jgi:hypothetical protein
MLRVALVLIALLAVTQAYRVQVWPTYTAVNSTVTCTGTKSRDEIVPDVTPPSCQANVVPGGIPLGAPANINFAAITFYTVTPNAAAATYTTSGFSAAGCAASSAVANATNVGPAPFGVSIGFKKADGSQAGCVLYTAASAAVLPMVAVLALLLALF